MEVKIRVGAQIDSSLRTAFRPLVQSAMDARRQILREFAPVPREISNAFATLGRTQGSTFRGATLEAQRSNREIVTSARQAAREQREAVRQAEREMLTEHRAYHRERARIDSDAASIDRQRSRALYREYVANERAARREVESFGRRTSYRAVQMARPLLSTARRAGSEVLRGFGVDPTVAGAFQRNIDLERISVDVSNSARLAGQQINPSDIDRRVREVSTRRAMSREDTASGLLTFQKKTGDARLGLELLDKMAERAAATNTSVTDFAGAMASASTALGDMPNKGARLLEIMDAVTVQGARGAVEVSDLARHFGRIAAASTAFGGDQAQNMKTLGALAQISMGKGGAPSAAEAVRSVTGFANTFKKPARLAQFQKATGQSAFTDSSNTTLRDPISLIKDALVGTKGDLVKMQRIFMDVIGGRAVTGFTKAFNDAGGGDKGLSAVDKLLSRFTDNTKLSQDLLDEANAERDQTTAAKVQRFQNALDDTAAEVQASLLPALQGLAPIAIQAAQALGGMAKFAVENPGKAITAAIVMSIGRAGLESAIRSAIERIFAAAAGATGGAGAGGAGKARNKLVGALGAAGAGLAIGVPIASAMYATGVATVEGSEANMTASGKLQNEVQIAAKNGKKIDPRRRAELHRKVLDEEEAIKALDQEMKGTYLGYLFNPGGMQAKQTEYMSRLGMLTKSKAALGELDSTRFAPDDEVARYRAKDSKTTTADMQAAFKRGGVAELEKIATLQSKQDTTAQQMLELQKSGNEILGEIRDKISAPSGTDNTPEVDTDTPAYQ